MKGQTYVAFENMVSSMQEPTSCSAEAHDITEQGDIIMHASVVVVHSPESIKDEPIWDEVHLRMNRMTRARNRAEFVFEHCQKRTKLSWRQCCTDS